MVCKGYSPLSALFQTYASPPPLPSADPSIALQIKATIRTLLVAGAPEEPSRWLALCGDVVMAAAPGTTALHTSASGSKGRAGRWQLSYTCSEQ